MDGAALAAERGIDFIDAPVSGSDGPARNGELVVLALGPQELHVLLEPIFGAIGRKTLWLGPAGQGTRLKLVLNNWLAAQVEAVAETVALAEALDVRPDLFTDTIADSPLGSPYSVSKGRAMVAGGEERQVPATPASSPSRRAGFAATCRRPLQSMARVLRESYAERLAFLPARPCPGG